MTANEQNEPQEQPQQPPDDHKILHGRYGDYYQDMEANQLTEHFGDDVDDAWQAAMIEILKTPDSYEEEYPDADDTPDGPPAPDQG